MMTPEVKAILDEILGPEPKPQPAKPRVVIRDDRPVRDADVRVSPADPNARNAVNGVVQVRRDDVVTINMAAAERQWWANERDRVADRAHRRQLDPFGYGHWGPSDE